MKEITVMVFEPGKPGYLKKVPDTLQAYQEIVGGNIEEVGLFSDCLLFCNEEGLLMDLPMNWMGIRGTFFACNAEGEEFASITEEQSETLLRLSQQPCPVK